jgi:hypothetical protein
MLLEVAKQPARGDAQMPARILARDQDRELERIAESDLRELLRSRLGSKQVPALKCLLDGPVGTAQRGRRSTGIVSSSRWSAERS